MPVTAPRGGPRSARTAAIRLLLVTAALLGSLLAGAAPASAHAVLTGSDPEQGAVVGSAPKEITLTFSDGVAMSDDSIRVLDPQGNRADTGELDNLCSGNTVKYGVALRSELPDGTFTVAWKAVSADGHPLSGAFTFSIGAPSRTTVALPEQQVGGGLVGALYGLGRYASYAGFAVLVGGGAFVLVCRPRGASVRPLQRLVVRGWLTITAATIALLLLRNPYTGSGELADAFDLGGLRAVLESKQGTALVSRLLLLGAAALFVSVLFGAYAQRTDSKERKDLAFGLGIGGAVVAAGLAATWALADHASTGPQTGIAMPVDVLHLFATAIWLGGLAALLVTLYRGPAIERHVVRRFSRVAFGSVVVLAATGLYQSRRQVGSRDALGSTSYGQLLLLKIALVAVLIGVAWISRRWTARLSVAKPPETEPTETGPAEADTTEREDEGPEAGTPETEEPAGRTVSAPADPRRAAQLTRQQAALAAARRKRIRDADLERYGLRRSVLAEAGIAVVLLAVTTMLTSTEPARTEKAARATTGVSTAVPDRPISLSIPFDTGGEDGRGSAQIDLGPGRTGSNTLHIALTGPDGKPLDAPQVKVSFTLSQDLGPLPVEPARVGTGQWSADGVRLPTAGEWQMSVTVRTSDIDQVTETKNVKIG